MGVGALLPPIIGFARIGGKEEGSEGEKGQEGPTAEMLDKILKDWSERLCLGLWNIIKLLPSLQPCGSKSMNENLAKTVPVYTCPHDEKYPIASIFRFRCFCLHCIDVKREWDSGYF